LVTTGGNADSITYNGALYIGTCWNTSHLKGHVSDYRLYDRELSTDEILTLYEQGNIDYELNLNIEET
jgi:hypothetical protein